MIDTRINEFIEADGWRLNYELKDGRVANFRRQHIHGDEAACVESVNEDAGDNPDEWMWQCSKCQEPLPDSMEGFIRMLKWDNKEIQ